MSRITLEFADIEPVLDLLKKIQEEIHNMSVTQSELNAQLVALQAAQDAESAALAAEAAKLSGFIADVLSAFTNLEAKIAAGAPPADLTAEAALVAAALQKVTDQTTAISDQSTSIDSPDAQARIEAGS